MSFFRRRLFLVSALGAVLAIATVVATPSMCHADPLHVYLLLGEEGSTDIGVQYHTVTQAEKSLVHYDTVSRGGDPAAYTHTAEGSFRTIAGLEDGRQIHGVMLTGLTPGTVYYFVAGDPKAGYSPEKSFRTPPGGQERLKFVIGGDIGTGPAAFALTRLAGQYDPHFAVVGGDIAYANGELRNIRIWDRWFSTWTANMVTREGHIIPAIMGIGNHETNKEESEDFHARSPFYMGFFWLQGDKPYFTRGIGGLVSFLMLDSGHLVPHADQVDFLRAELERHADTPAKFPVYHVPLYPGHRDYDGGASVLGRERWMPLFEEYGVRVAFENHDHVLKRSHPLRGGEISPNDGIVYIGDGCFGVGNRDVEPRWYLEVNESKQHFWLAEVDADRIHLVAIDVNGDFADNVAISLHSGPPAVAAAE